MASSWPSLWSTPLYNKACTLVHFWWAHSCMQWAHHRTKASLCSMTLNKTTRALHSLSIFCLVLHPCVFRMSLSSLQVGWQAKCTPKMKPTVYKMPERGDSKAGEETREFIHLIDINFLQPPSVVSASLTLIIYSNKHWDNSKSEWDTQQTWGWKWVMVLAEMLA